MALRLYQEVHQHPSSDLRGEVKLIATLMDMWHLKKCGIRAEISELQRSCRTSRRDRQRRLKNPTPYLQNKAHLRRK